MQSEDPFSKPRDDDYDDYLRRVNGHPEERSVFFLIVEVVAVCFHLLSWPLRWLWWLFSWPLRWLRRLLENPIGREIKGCVKVPVIIGIFLYFELLNRLKDRLNPRIIRITEQGEGFLTFASPCWLLFENAMKSEVRVCAGNGRGEVPKELHGRGMLLPPGQKRKIYVPAGSSYDIEVYGMDGQRLEQMKLRMAISSFLAD